MALDTKSPARAQQTFTRNDVNDKGQCCRCIDVTTKKLATLSLFVRTSAVCSFVGNEILKQAIKLNITQTCYVTVPVVSYNTQR